MNFKSEVQEIKSITPELLTLHPEALATPKMSSIAYDALKRDIEINGQLDPVITYRGKIVDGRHRWLIIQELGIDFIKYIELPNNTTIAQLRRLVQSKETRRHETATQLAISALRHITKSNEKMTQAEASKMFGVGPKAIGFAKKILVDYKREDLLDILFDGGKINIGTSYQPFMTDSLKTIVNWLDDNKATSVENKIGITARTELTEDENIIVNQFVRSVQKESKFVLDEIANRIYSLVKGEE